MKNTYQKTLAATFLLTGVAGVSTQAQEAAPAEKPKEEPKWSQSAGLGFTLAGGNSDSVLFTAEYNGSKNWGNNEISLGVGGGYGKADDVVNNNFVAGFAQYNRLFGPQKRWYGFGRVDARHDEVADIAYRVPIAVGLGYYFLKEGVNDNKKFNLSAEVGPGYAWEKVGGVYDEYATVYVGEKFTWKISEKTRAWQSLNYSPQISDFGNYTLSGTVGIETDLIDNLVLRSAFFDSYRSEPAPGRVGNDYKFITSIAYKF